MDDGGSDDSGPVFGAAMKGTGRGRLSSTANTSERRRNADDDDDLGYHSGGSGGFDTETDNELPPSRSGQSGRSSRAPSDASTFRKPPKGSGGSLGGTKKGRSVRDGSRDSFVEEDKAEYSDSVDSDDGLNQDDVYSSDDEFRPADQVLNSKTAPTNSRLKNSEPDAMRTRFASTFDPTMDPNLESVRFTSVGAIGRRPMTPHAEGTPKKPHDHSDVVHQKKLLAGLPDAYSPSFLAPLIKGDHKRLSSFLLPALNDTGLTFKDIDPATQSRQFQNRKDENVCTVRVTVVDGRNIEVPQVKGVKITNRRLRITIFDPANDNDPFAGNVFTLSAVWEPKSPSTWNFPSKRGVFSVRTRENEFVIRTDVLSSSLQILFEMTIVIEREVKGKVKRCEVSCGHSHLNLFTKDQDKKVSPQVLGRHELPLHHGTPFDDHHHKKGGHDRGPAATKKGAFASLGRKIGKGAPSLTIKLARPGPELKHLQDNNPNNVIMSISTLEVVSIYRDILGGELVNPKYAVNNVRDGTGQSADLISNPVLPAFLHILNSSDLLEALKALWIQKKLNPPAKFRKKDDHSLRDMFIETVLEIYPLLHLANVPTNIAGSADAARIRYGAIRSFLEDRRKAGAPKPGENLIHSDVPNRPFDISEVIFDPLPVQKMTQQERAPPTAFFSP